MKTEKQYETEGARAYMNGDSIGDCPYKNPSLSQVDACRSWVKGYEMEKEYWEVEIKAQTSD